MEKLKEQKVKQIIKYFNLDERTRRAENVDPRFLFYSYLYKNGYKLAEIGKFFNRNHVNVLNGVRKNKIQEETKKVSYVKKSAADAPGAKGNQKKDYATPASETKAGKAAAERKALAETRKKQTKRQAVRDAKKSADYDTNNRQERKNIRDEAAAMSGEAYGKSKRDLRKAQKNEKKGSKDTGKMTKTVKPANKPEEFKKSIDPKTPMAKKTKY